VFERVVARVRGAGLDRRTQIVAEDAQLRIVTLGGPYEDDAPRDRRNEVIWRSGIMVPALVRAGRDGGIGEAAAGLPIDIVRNGQDFVEDTFVERCAGHARAALAAVD